MKNQTPDMATPNMADTKASNGQLTVKHKAEKDPASSLKNIGTAIYNPLTDKYVGRSHYNKLRREGIELCQLERNSWINEFDGTLTMDEFLNQPHVRMLKDKVSLVEPATEEELDAQEITKLKAEMKEALKSNHLSLLKTTVGQANQIDELNKELNQMHVDNRQLLSYLDKLYTKAEVLSKTATDLCSIFSGMLNKDA
jgi:hypothetical protein